MLGPVLDTYKTNVRMTAYTVVLGVTFCTPLWFAFRETKSPAARITFLAVLAFFALLIAERLTARAYLHDNGISYHSILNHKEIRWVEVERLYYGAHQVSAHVIPLGTFYQLKLLDQNGQKLSLGDRVGRIAQLAEKIAQYTYEPLLQKATHNFDRGEELDFGLVRVSRSAGLKVKSWSSYTTIPWADLAAYKLDAGNFYLWRVGQKHTNGIPTERIPNAWVLLGLLNTVSNQKSRD
ncbi:MAG: hypothetical protein JWO71_2995 [Candidatus Acidoferrum typicum]|nr:hypothetical protein [Candidatus Acidoferrum typicum]